MGSVRIWGGTMRRTIRVLVLGGVVAACLAGASSASASLVCNTGCFFKSIQAAISAAQPGATITVGAGNYYENLVVDKPLTVRGAGTKTVIYPAVSMPICAGGSLCGGTASNIILVQASNVTLTGLWLKGDNPTLTSGVIVGGEDIDARNGII